MSLDPRPSDAELLARLARTPRATPPAHPLATKAPRRPNRKQGTGMNKTEAKRDGELREMQAKGEIQWYGFEAITLKLAFDTRYTPDFAIVDAEGNVCFEETKGFWRDDAKVKIKVAARLFPHFKFTAMKKRSHHDGGGWRTEEFKP